MKISSEIDGLLRFYSGRKLISVKDIREFSETWVDLQERLKETITWENCPDRLRSELYPNAVLPERNKS